ncbi:MAG: GatB/YqeY domain-containing protein [Cryomorphaceae bacterium]
MTIGEQINADIKSAMLAKDKSKLEALRAIKSAILLIASEKAGTEVSDDDAVKAMQKLVKQRKDAAAIYIEQGRKDMADVEEYQAGVIAAYLPAMMSEEDVRRVVLEKIKASGATGPQDMGKVMGPIMGQLNGKADGKLISQLVKEELAKL